ncbi:hypothetical protein [Paraconexibacter sp.]|uniref:hypothetical protein n=1 Tax=Paraconexibacter sp. TaxID=2949640 RepID=UPI0035655172
MGKRSRKRGGVEAAERPRPPREDRGRPAAPARRASVAGRPPARSQYDVEPATSLFGRVAESWRVAGQRPSKEVPKDQRRAVRPERPPGIFGGLPVSEIVMFAGLVGVVVSFARGPGASETGLLVSLAAVGLATFELTAREHFSGYRSHSFFLALIITVAVHAGVAYGVGGEAGKSPFLIMLDLVLFAGLGWTFGARYKRARRALRGGAR